MLRILKIAGILLVVNQSLFAQYQIGLIPRKSPDTGLYHKTGYTEINIRYGSPKVNNRQIFGNLVPFDKVWRAGANNATTIEFSTDVIIDDKLIEKGKYSFFIIPSIYKKWIGILNNKSEQWGAFRYDSNLDIARFELVTDSINNQENLTYSANSLNFDRTQISLKWANMKTSFNVSTNHIDRFVKDIEDRVKNVSDDNIKSVIFIQGANYLVTQKSFVDLALQWIEKAQYFLENSANWNKQYYPKEYVFGDLYWTKAKLSAEQSDYRTALEYVEKMKAIGKDISYPFYENNRDFHNIDELIESWKRKITHSKSWIKLNTEPYRGKQDDITFINKEEGWYVNGYGKIFHTNDGGKTWKKQIEQKGTFFRTIAFIDKLNGFAGTVGKDYFPNVTDSIPLYRTKDGGKTWMPVSYNGPYVKGLCAIDIVKEQYINHGKIDYKTHLYAVGRVGSPANIMISHDFGETWISKSMDENCKMLFDIKMLDKNNGIVCAATSEDIAKSNALILKTTDGGNSWKKVYQSNRPYETTWKVSFPTDKVGYATIQSYNPDPTVSQQRIIKTTDGGDSWKEINLTNDSKAREFGIGFIDENQGYVGTMKSGYETKDGGLTWKPVDLGMACNKIRFYKDEEGQIYGCAIGVNIFKFQ